MPNSISEPLLLFAQTCVAIGLEAAPFLLLGALLSGLFEVFAPATLIERSFPRGRVSGVAAGMLLGTLLPTCECGVVPVVRRLLAKGMPPQTAMSYMLTAPVVNPVVLAATYVAFAGNLWMVAGRVALVCLAAGAVSLLLAGKPAAALLREPYPADSARCACGCGHDHGPAAPEPLLLTLDQAVARDQATAQAPAGPGLGAKLWAAGGHMASDFLDAGQYLFLGAMAAAAFKTLLPPELALYFASNLALSVGFMLALAVLLSVCSEADAFVAASFVSFPAAAQLAFVSLGPIFDLKLLLMYSGTFRPRVVLLLGLLPALVIGLLCLALGWGFAPAGALP
jgi:uncharacterized protein